MDAGGRATHGAVAEEIFLVESKRQARSNIIYEIFGLETGSELPAEWEGGQG
jgi:hypothetical protein